MVLAYVYFKLLATLNLTNHRKIYLFKFHSTVCLHYSEESQICGASRDVSGSYHFNMPRRAGAKFDIKDLRCFVFLIFLYFFLR